ncbi:sulfatase [Vibrio nigripulchritudo]|uniref:sulfatase n=1 Tax=Vibrio nigripulchritudo TaxID=28173 RepID=UPI002492952A|nr:sulfatase [Vibrio nigripulchritudo]BDU39870.1 sulfatase [Vibrio nigripulchritudo]BDU45594.1 sulfatase [Vibrio nigripulchritudo]
MRTVFVLFDSLNRAALGSYGGTAISTPNFDRFAKRAVTFDKHYAGSLPCMPARRDMHTGRLNFMHRPWGPLEPFDNSFASLLSKNGVYTHIVSDHLHYFENGGSGYVNAFDSWDFIRGQEYDVVKALVQPPIDRLREKYNERHYPMGSLDSGSTITRESTDTNAWRRSRHTINSMFIENEADYPTAKCFQSAMEFLELNQSADNWFLQLECFDPHEPFTAPSRFRESYKTDYKGKILDWPLYEKVTDSVEEIAEIRANYAALVSMCDEYFGKLLDWFDENQAWGNTALILTTDHGFLLGEHDWWAKNKMPYYEEISHIPLMMWHPEQSSEPRVDQLTQTADLMPTLLDFYGITIPEEVTSHSLSPLLMAKSNSRETAILGMFAGPICVTDGRYTYYRFPKDLDGDPLHAYTLMPSHMHKLFTGQELKTAELVSPFDFTKGVPVLQITPSQENTETGIECVKNWGHQGSCLFDLSNDPKQLNAIDDPDVTERLNIAIVKHLERHDAPEDIYEYYGLTAHRQPA